jgi:hypothetical protein
MFRNRTDSRPPVKDEMTEPAVKINVHEEPTNYGED